MLQIEEQARTLRLLGYSTTEICRDLKIPQSTLSTWISDIKITEDQKIAILKKGHEASAEATRRLGSERRSAYRKRGHEKIVFNTINDLAIVGAALYWAEGNKDRNVCCLSNTDIAMLKLWIRCLKECLDISEVDIKFSLYVPQNTDCKECVKKYALILALPESQCSGCYIKSTVSQKVVCKIIVFSTEVVQKIYGMIDVVVGEGEIWQV